MGGEAARAGCDDRRGLIARKNSTGQDLAAKIGSRRRPWEGEHVTSHHRCRRVRGRVAHDRHLRRRSQSRRLGQGREQRLSGDARGSARGRLRGRRVRLSGDEARGGEEARQERSERAQVRRLPAVSPRGRRERRRRGADLRLRALVQRLRGHAEQGPGGQAARRQGRRLGPARLAVAAEHRQHADLPRPERVGRHLEPAGRAVPGGRGRRDRRRRHRHLARAPELRRHRLRPRARRVERRVRVGRAVDQEQLQRQADRRPLLREGLRPLRRRALGRLPVRARSRRSRHPHRVDGGRQRWRRRDGLRPQPRHGQRHRPASADRGLQGVLARGLRQQRHDRRDRRGRRRRRRRHQLLDRRRRIPTSSTRTTWRSCSPARRACSSQRPPATTGRTPARSTTEAPG